MQLHIYPSIRLSIHPSLQMPIHSYETIPSDCVKTTPATSTLISTLLASRLYFQNLIHSCILELRLLKILLEIHRSKHAVFLMETGPNTIGGFRSIDHCVFVLLWGWRYNTIYISKFALMLMRFTFLIWKRHSWYHFWLHVTSANGIRDAGINSLLLKTRKKSEYQFKPPGDR